jgi:hypothetical protein
MNIWERVKNSLKWSSFSKKRLKTAKNFGAYRVDIELQHGKIEIEIEIVSN